MEQPGHANSVRPPSEADDAALDLCRPLLGRAGLSNNTARQDHLREGDPMNVTPSAAGTGSAPRATARTKTRPKVVGGGIVGVVAVAALMTTTTGPAHAETDDPCADAMHSDEAGYWYDIAEGFVVLARTSSRLGARDLADSYWDL